MPTNSVPPPDARPARAEDRGEILRIVGEVYRRMHAVYGGTPPNLDEKWQARVEESLDRRLGRDVAIYVIDGEEGRLASVAVGRLSETLPSPRRENVMEGYIEWVGTDPAYRGRGYASSVTTHLLGWFRSQEATSVSLNASPEAESLYRKMGFTDEGPRALSIRLT